MLINCYVTLGIIKTNPSYYLTILWLFLSYTLISQQPTMWQLTDEDGLPSNTVYDLLQDEKGYIWMGTSYGICRYDGKAFKKYSIPHFKDHEILRIKEDRWRRLWVTNLAGQLSCLQNQTMIPDTFLNQKHIFDISFNKDALWIIFQETKKIRSNKTFGVARIQFDSKGNIKNHFIYATRYARFLFSHSDDLQGQLQAVGYHAGGQGNSFLATLDANEEQITIIKNIQYRVLDKVKSKDGHLYIYDTETKQVLDIHPDETVKFIHQFQVHGELNNFKVFDDYYLFSTQNGLFYKKSSPTSNKNKAQHWLKQITCNSIMLDNEGNHWITTDGQGVFIIPSLEIKSYTTNTGDLPNNNVYSILYDQQKEQLLVGVDNGKVVILKAGKVIRQIDLPNNGRVLDIIKLDEAYWCFTDSGIIQIWKDGSINKISNAAGKHGFADHNKSLLAGTSLGFETYDYNIINFKTTQPIRRSKGDLNDKRVYALHRDHNQSLWIGTPQGLFVKKDSIQPFTNDQQHQYSITSIAQTADNTLWIGTLGNGIFSIKNDTIHQILSEANGLSSNTCKNIFVDGNQLWVGTNKGINIVNLNNMSIRYFNKFDGLPANEITSIEIIDSIAWVGTSKGLVSFNKNHTKHNINPPPVYITNLKVWDRDTSVNDTIRLKHDLNSIQIEYIGFGYSTQGNIRYKYKMDGVDSDWNLTNTNQVRYSSLRPGDYTFQVIAINEDQVESRAPAKIHLTIAVPWWDSYWFKILLGLAVITGLSSLYIWTSHLKERKQNYQNTVNELRLQALQTQVNPHFIFNALNAIQQFQVVNEKEKAIDYLSQFAHLIRMIFEHSKEKTITLSQEIDFLSLYLELEKLRFQDKVTIELKLSPELTTNQQLIKVPPLLIQPIVENAFKHGLFHKGHGGRLSVNFHKKEDYLICIIEDNGVGRAAAQKISMQRHKSYQPSGLRTSEKRLKIYNSNKITHDNPLTQNIKVIDLFDKNQEPTGTKVELRILIKRTT